MSCVCVSVGGVLSLGIYTVLFLKLYSYQDTNRWCREIRQAKAKKLTRSYSCKYMVNRHQLAEESRLKRESLRSQHSSEREGRELGAERFTSGSADQLERGPNMASKFQSQFYPWLCCYSHLVVTRQSCCTPDQFRPLMWRFSLKNTWVWWLNEVCVCGFQVRLFHSPMARRSTHTSPTQETSHTEVKPWRQISKFEYFLC